MQHKSKKLLRLHLPLLVLLVTLGLTCSVLAATYTGSRMAAINMDTGSDTLLSADFTANRPTAAMESDSFAQSGTSQAIPDAQLPQLKPQPADPSLPTYASVEAHKYTRDSTLRYIEMDGSTVNTLRCLYVGTHCTVWGSTSDPTDVQLNTQGAAAIGVEFDTHFAQMCQYFGSYWYDADNDGKVAILCYDIEHEYAAGNNPAHYIGGYFSMQDMLDPRGQINGISYGASYFLNGLDCINIDTFPFMGRSPQTMSKVSDVYSTLFHEFQHMINFSYQVQNGPEGYYDEMEVYLNEAFSMAAEHLILGADATSNRCTYFNGGEYIPGSPLTYWRQDLSNYSNSYLFGQYLRTRYEQLHPGQGATIYKTILANRNADNCSDTLQTLADLLHTTKQELVTDFWQAVCRKSDSGIYGFNGESWANVLQVHVSDNFSDTGNIYNGGAKFYRLSDTPLTVRSDSPLQFTAFADLTPAGPGVQAVTLSRTGPRSAQWNLTSTQSGILHYLCSTDPVTDKSLLTNQLAVTAGQGNVLSLSDFSGTDTPTVYYYITAPDGTDSALLRCDMQPWTGNFNDVSTNAWYYESVVYSAQHELFQGVTPTQFQPESGMTRAMLVTVLWRMAGSPDAPAATAFADVASNTYYTNAVSWAASTHIVQGINGKFVPNANVTREQMATFLYRYAAVVGNDTSARASLSAFPDATQCAAYATDPLRWAVAENLINGISAHLQPKSPATRAQVATILMRFHASNP